jgi:hypothetical protein
LGYYVAHNDFDILEDIDLLTLCVFFVRIINKCTHRQPHETTKKTIKTHLVVDMWRIILNSFIINV